MRVTTPECSSSDTLGLHVTADLEMIEICSLHGGKLPMVNGFML